MYITVRSEECAPGVTCNYLATSLSRGIFKDGSIAAECPFIFPTSCVSEVSAKLWVTAQQSDWGRWSNAANIWPLSRCLLMSVINDITRAAQVVWPLNPPLLRVWASIRLHFSRTRFPHAASGGRRWGECRGGAPAVPCSASAFMLWMCEQAGWEFGCICVAALKCKNSGRGFRPQQQKKYYRKEGCFFFFF